MKLNWIQWSLLGGLLFTACDSPRINTEIKEKETTEKIHGSIEELEKEASKVQVALILDTSGSMSGLIEQAKQQLWKIVNEVSKAKSKSGETPMLEIALFQYGNDGLSVRTGYVELICPFTSELDEISEKLFVLKTNGGSEYCGTVIKKALENLEWSNNESDLKMVFIAGNEPFNQGYDDYKEVCFSAKNQEVVVNTIFCGPYQDGIATWWKDGADISGGEYLNIDKDGAIVHIPSPYDDQINQLNMALNNTYLPYGRLGNVKKEKQLQQDSNALSQSASNQTKRAMAKSKKAYYNKSWDLVDAANEKDFDLSQIEEDALPSEMRGLSKEEKLNYIQQHKENRERIKAEINTLGKSREAHVAKIKAEQSSGTNQLDEAIVKAVRKNGEKKALTFEIE